MSKEEKQKEREKGKDIPPLECRVLRIARRDKKAFLNEQCKEVEENNRMGKNRNLFKEIKDIKGTFQARTGTINDRNGKDLTEVEEINMRRWQEYTEELYKEGRNEPDTMMVWSLT